MNFNQDGMTKYTVSKGEFMVLLLLLMNILTEFRPSSEKNDQTRNKYSIGYNIKIMRKLL